MSFESKPRRAFAGRASRRLCFGVRAPGLGFWCPECGAHVRFDRSRGVIFVGPYYRIDGFVPLLVAC